MKLASSILPLTAPAELADHLISAWTFDQPPVKGYQAEGHHRATLQPVGEPPERITIAGHGVALRFDGRHQLRVTPAEVGPLNRGGEGKQVTVMATLRWRGGTPWQFVAGLWDESLSQRQYGLFVNARGYPTIGGSNRQPCHGRVHGHVSDIGGPTSGKNVCTSYATGITSLPTDRIVRVAMSYDGRYSRVFVDDQVDRCPGANPYPLHNSLFAEPQDAAFTVGSNSVGGETRNFLHADVLAIAVYGAALV